VSPATVLEAVDGYRAAFKPSGELERPHVSVSADVVVADTEAAARELAAGFGTWVRSIRTAEGAIPFPTPEQARRHQWTDADELIITTITHDHPDRVHSYRLLAEEWARR
jgi:alkanesulfonate monooxygenase SsuD/methylene tetrahydromethanopterin reductase-like flavin-dependent oxidoreductase (luciferase family)